MKLLCLSWEPRRVTHGMDVNPREAISATPSPRRGFRAELLSAPESSKWRSYGGRGFECAVGGVSFSVLAPQAQVTCGLDIVVEHSSIFSVQLRATLQVRVQTTPFEHYFWLFSVNH
jgi:hypothetical protein